jgi:hypothetical protein
MGRTSPSRGEGGKVWKRQIVLKNGVANAV